jgi:multiple sugar transport system permease protein
MLNITRRREKLIFIWTSLGVILALYFLLYLLPMLFSLMKSFYIWNPLQRSDRFIGVSNYIKMWRDFVFRKSFQNTLVLALYVIPSNVIISLIVALGLNSLGRKLGGFFTAVYFLPVITSWVASAIVWKWIYHPSFGLFNYFLGLIGIPNQPWLSSPRTALASVSIVAVWKNIGFGAVILLAGLRAIPRIFYESAELDGANRWALFRHITLPLLNPVLLFVSVMITIYSFQTFDLVYIMPPGGMIAGGGGPANATKTLVLNVYNEGIRRLNMGYASAQACILFIIMIVATLLQKRAKIRQ